MKFTAEVVAAFETLRDAAENDFERCAVTTLESDLKFFANEVWRDVVGYEGLYQVSNFGRVKSFQRKTHRLLTVDTANMITPRFYSAKTGAVKRSRFIVSSPKRSCPIRRASPKSTILTASRPIIAPTILNGQLAVRIRNMPLTRGSLPLFAE